MYDEAATKPKAANLLAETMSARFEERGDELGVGDSRQREILLVQMPALGAPDVMALRCDDVSSCCVPAFQLEHGLESA